MSWKLKVWYNSATVEYDNVVFEDDDYTIDEAASSDAIEYGDIQVQIDGDFLGATDIDDLPTTDGEGYNDFRCSLLYNDVEYLNGVIRRHGGCTWEPDFQRWHLSIESVVESDFLDRLEEIQMGDDENNIDPVFEGALPEGSLLFVTGRTSALGIVYNGAYDISLLWEAVDSLLTDVVVNLPAPLFQFEVKYNDGGTDKTITRTHKIAIDCFASPLNVEPGGNENVGPFRRAASMPHWNAREFFEALQVFHGWTIRGKFDAYPSRNITVDLIQNKWVAPTNPVILDGRVEERGLEEYSIEEPEFEDFGVRYSWKEGGYNDRDTYSWKGDRFDSLAETGYHQDQYSSAATSSLYQADKRRFDRESQPYNDDLIELPFFLPYIWRPRWTRDNQPDAVNHPNYLEDVLIADNIIAPKDAQGKPHLFELDPDISPGIVMYRQPTVTLQSGQETYVSPLSPYQVIKNYEIARSELITLSARFDLNDASPLKYTVGDPQYGVQFDSDDYMVLRRNESPIMKGVDLELARIVKRDDPTFGGIIGDEGHGTPLEASGTCACTSDQFDFSLSWTAPGGEQDPYAYEIQYRPYYKQDWQDLTEVAFPGTSYDFNVDAFGEERGVFFFRIRALYYDPSGAASPWVSFLVEAPTCGESSGGEANCWEEVQGKVALAAGDTSVIVVPSPKLSTSLASTIENVIITAEPLGDYTPATRHWVSDIGSNSFQINVDAGGASDVQFAWRVVRLKKEVDGCDPCWRIDTYHSKYASGSPTSIPASTCAPVEQSTIGHWFFQPYVISGEAYLFSRDRTFIKYTPSDGAGAGNVFTALADMDHPYDPGATWPDVGAASAGYNGVLYAIPDLDDSGHGGTGDYAFMEYDPVTDTWSEHSRVTLPFSDGVQSIAGMATLFDGLMVWNENGKTIVWDAGANTWTADNDMPFTGIAGVAVNVRAVFNAWDNFTWFVFGNEMYRYFSSFTLEDTLSDNIYRGAICVEDTGEVHYFGGRDDPTGTPYERQFEHLKWDRNGNGEHYWKDLPRAIDACTAFVIDDVVYVGLGEWGGSGVQNSHTIMWAYVPDINIANPFTGELSV